MQVPEAGDESGDEEALPRPFVNRRSDHLQPARRGRNDSRSGQGDDPRRSAPRDRSERMILNNYVTMQTDRRGPQRSAVQGPDLRAAPPGDRGDPGRPDGRRPISHDDEYRVVGDDFGEVFHQPPPAAQLEERMEAMCRFANRVGLQRIHTSRHPINSPPLLARIRPSLRRRQWPNGPAHLSTGRCSTTDTGSLNTSRSPGRSCGVPVQYGEAFLHTETDDNDLTYFIVYHLDIINRAIEELHRFIEDRGQELRTLDARLRGIAELESQAARA